MRETIDTSMDFLAEDDYDTPTLGMKFDRSSDNFVAMEIDEIRDIRNKLLIATDWRATVDYPNIDKGAWLEYRQALRDLPQEFPNVAFPTEPSQYEQQSQKFSEFT